jgi:hypothetical protein
MASIGKLLTPVVHTPSGVGHCIGSEWYRGSTLPCPTPLDIYHLGDGLAGGMAVNFNGRGKVGDAGSSCGGFDPYVTGISFTDYLTVDVWAALRAGVWSSSCIIQVYMATGAPIVGEQIQAYPPSGSLGVTKNVTTQAGTCGTVVLATITVNDDGTYSIA